MPTSLHRSAIAVLALTSMLWVAAAPPAHARPGAATSPGRSAPLLGADLPARLPDRYIVVLRTGVALAAASRTQDAAQQAGADVSRRYTTALHGFAARMSATTLARVEADANVQYVEADGVMRATQTPATWGLDRIDQRKLPLDNSYGRTETGAGVTAYIIDTGIHFHHQEFGGRAVKGFDAVDGGTAEDCAGHGTHVAGTVGGASMGVASAVRLVAVRVLDCQGSGSVSGVIAGIDWVSANHRPAQPAVANMSLGGAASTALDTAITTSINGGITYAVAAGNGDAGGNPQDACLGSPSRVPAAITTSATDRQDQRGSWANVGPCVDLFAPGVNITSAGISSDTDAVTMSGTSMASPHVAGAAARYLQGHPTASPKMVRDALVAAATPGVVGDAGAHTPNLLLYVLQPAPAKRPPAMVAGGARS